jgi:pimeloyl-ACP methyl ester carboxylesterase
VQDIVDCVKWALANHPIDPDRVYIMGSSGGGHMTLLMAGRHPELFAGAYSACPITDVARWYEESSDPKRNLYTVYAGMMKAACGGTPAEKREEYVHRSPLTWIASAKTAALAVSIVTGVHDGHKKKGGGSVPVGHTIRAFNAIAEAKDRIGEDAIKIMEKEERVPEELQFSGAVKFFNSRVWLRRVSGNVRVTIFEAGHAGNYTAGVDWFSRQARGRPVDWSEGGESSKAAEVNNVTH